MPPGVALQPAPLNHIGPGRGHGPWAFHMILQLLDLLFHYADLLLVLRLHLGLLSQGGGDGVSAAGDQAQKFSMALCPNHTPTLAGAPFSGLDAKTPWQLPGASGGGAKAAAKPLLGILAALTAFK